MTYSVQETLQCRYRDGVHNLELMMRSVRGWGVMESYMEVVFKLKKELSV